MITVQRAIDRLNYLASGRDFMYRIPDHVAQEVILLIESQNKEISRLNNSLKHEQHRADRQGTHADGCYKWGPEHYECAMAEIDKLKTRTHNECQEEK